MDSFEFNKIAGAILATALGVMALSIVSEIIFAPVEAQQPGLIVAGVDPGDDGHGAAGGGGQPPAEVIPIAVRLQTADLEEGEDSAGKCKACHTFDEGDTRKTPGPNLWGVVGGPVAHLEGFSYSDALMEKHDEGMTWTFENLDHFLFAPKAFIPETAMTFAGLKRDEERANVIAYLRTLSNDPVPLPAVTAEAPAAAPAEHAPATEAPAPPAAAEPAPTTASEPPATQVQPEAPAVAPVEPAPATPAPSEPAH